MARNREYCLNCENLRLEWPTKLNPKINCYCETEQEEQCAAKHTKVICGTNKRFAIEKNGGIEIIEREVV
jgi:hypothetical protein